MTSILITTEKVIGRRILTSYRYKSSTASPIVKSGYETLNCDTPYNLVFLRHGQSTWNRDNRFIGWTDTPLTEDGVLEARVAGQMLEKSGVLFDEVHTSLLRRSIRTTNLVLMETGQEYIPVHKTWRLNERNYGALVGKNKKEMVLKYGVEKIQSWRRSFSDPPPPQDESHPYYPGKDPRYRHMIGKIPLSESLEDTMKRAGLYWSETIVPSIKSGKTVLIVGHENNLRSIIKLVENIPDDEIINLSLPRAVPLAYRLDENLKPIPRKDGKLDEATGFLNAEWIGGDKAVKTILERDDKQVYDTTITQNLELGSNVETWRNWMEFLIGKGSPEMLAKSAHSEMEDGGIERGKGIPMKGVPKFVK